MEIDADRSGAIDFFEFMGWWREYSIRKVMRIATVSMRIATVSMRI
jgi:hypothetical protein